MRDLCCFGPSAVVSGHIPKGAIVGSQKWRVLKQRDLDKYDALKAAGKFH